MIKLTKLRLINWHYFANTTIDVENITFLTGANGTGKSTVIDALQIVLLGDTSGRNFNKAANEKNGRTLRGYLRCETGETSDGKILALRPGRFTSYIACQFYDSEKDRDFTLGIVFECYPDGKDERHFFWLGTGFPANNFTNKDLLDKEAPRALTYTELNDFLASHYKKEDYRFFDTNEQYRQNLKAVLGNLPDKYFSLFKKSVSFVPISDISQFITEFVCDVDYKVDIEPMRKNIQQYRMLQIESDNIRKRVAALQGIQDAFDNYKKLQKDMGALTYVTARAEYEYAKKNFEGYQDKLKFHTDSLNSISIQLNQIDSQIQDLNKDRETWLAKKLSSAGYSVSASLKARKDSYDQRIAALKLQAQNIAKAVNQYVTDFASAATSVLNAFKYVNLDDLSMDERQKDACSAFVSFAAEMIQLCHEVKDSCMNGTLDPKCLENLQVEMEGFKTKGQALYSDIETLLFNQSRTREQYSSQLRSIGSGKKPFPGLYQACLKEFTETLTARHSDAWVKIFCDCIDVNDQEWVNSLEACLGGNLLNVFVNPEYYTEAYRILKDINQVHDFYHLNVIDSERVMEFMDRHPANDDSVAHLIDANFEPARAYADYLLGRIRKCQTFEEARAAGTGLLSDCSGYRNFTTWYLRKPTQFFIGTKVDMGTASAINDIYQKVSKAVSILTSLKECLGAVTSLAAMSKNEALTYRDDLLQSNEIPDYEAKAARLEEEMKEGALKNVSEIDEKIKAIDTDIRALNEQKEQLTVQKGEHTSEIRRIKDEVLPEKEALMETRKQTLEKFTPAESQEYSGVYESLFQSMNLEQIKEAAQIRYNRAREKQSVQKSNLIKLRSQYVSTYNLSYDVTIEDNNDVYSNELKQLSEVQLPAYTQKIKEAHDNSIKEFKDDFVYKLRTLIETVQTQIEELNSALVDVRFGRDKYRFTVTPNKDFLDYYNMIMDPMLLSAGDADELFMETYKQQMDQLFMLISGNQDDMSQQDRDRIAENIARFTDYRTYLVFDLLVKRGDGPDVVESSLAHSFKRQSGGETQTPFYISILASFAQLYRCSSDADTLRLVIFDEAFSKMDSVRIKEAVGLLRSFGLQGLISTPPEKLRDLAKLVDESLVAIHDEKHKLSYLDLYEDTTRKIGEIKAWDLKPKTPEEETLKPAEPAPEGQKAEPEKPTPDSESLPDQEDPSADF